MAKTLKKHRFHMRRVGLLATLVVAFFIVRLDSGTMPGPLKNVSHVLAYASEMSQGALLSGTNAARGANGLGGFSLNSQLNNSAQAKAQHMATNDYWAHVAPDGTQPWYFFTQAGYSYIRAGENLAYGFTTSQGTIDGWMNSASHRANILGDYAEVGFGIVNTPNYQSSGEQTIVVAHYGTRATPPPEPVASPIAPASPAPQSPPAAPAPVAETPVEAPAAPVAPAAPLEETNQNPTDDKSAPSPQSTAAPVQTASQSRVSVLSMIAARNLSIAALVSLSMVAFAITGYALTHRSAFQHAVAHGEQFVVRHPGVDTGIIAAITSLILMTTYGNLS